MYPFICISIYDMYCEGDENIYEHLYDVDFDELYEEADKHKYMIFYDLTHNKFMVQDKETGEDVNLTNNEEGYNQKVIEKGKNVKTLVTIYKYLNIPTFIVASIAYVIYSFVTLIQLFKKKLVNLEMWVVISSVLGAMLSIMMGIAYETAFNAYVITAMYLSVAYPLMLLFSMLMISVSILKIIEWIKNRKRPIVFHIFLLLVSNGVMYLILVEFIIFIVYFQMYRN